MAQGEHPPIVHMELHRPGYHRPLQDLLVRWAEVRRLHGVDLDLPEGLGHLLDVLLEAYDDAETPLATMCNACGKRPAVMSVEPGWAPTYCRRCYYQDAGGRP